MAHTPGPWRFEEGTKTIRAVPSNHWLASMNSWDGAVDHAANARLIAAAPDMLAALKLVADSGKFSCFDDSAWDAVNDAIAKAEGAA